MGGTSMKITQVECFIVDLPFNVPFRASWRPGFEEKTLAVTVVKVHTDEGITGIASAEACFGWGEAQKATIDCTIGPLLVGKDPFAIEQLIKIIRDGASYGGRPWLVENALWDIVGKAAHQPIYKLWGGAQDRVLAYASWGELRTPERRAQDALALVEGGYKAVKVKLHFKDPREDLALVEAVRKAVGDKLEIMVDANQASVAHRPPRTKEDEALYSVWSVERATLMARELEKLNVIWLEEPLDRYNWEGLRRLAQTVQIWIAGGEINRGLNEFKTLVLTDVYDVIQANCTLSEGMFQLRKVAALAEMCYKPFVPHAWIPGPGFAASLQLAGSIPNCPYIEYPCDPPSYSIDLWQMLLTEKIRIDKEGYLPVPQGPGLGVELDEGVIRKYRRT
jgi:L-alanine-DL-glutamate epimerase-like enolase superfamily enzyme